MRDKMVKRLLRIVAMMLCMVFVFVMALPKVKRDSGNIFIDEWEQETPLSDSLSIDEYYAILAEVLVMVPQNVLDQFYADGWGIMITQENLSDKYFNGIYSNVMAVTDGYIKVIWISASERAIRSSVIHEMGHYIEFTYNYPNDTEAFKAIYEEERMKFVVVGGSPAQARGSSLEYFAEAFQEYFLHPDSLMINTPKTYQYIANYVANF